MSSTVGSNVLVRDYIEIPAEGPKLVEPLLVLKENLDGVSVRVLKDEGCNTNMISPRFLYLNRHCFKLKRAKATVNHFKDGSDEIS